MHDSLGRHQLIAEVARLRLRKPKEFRSQNDVAKFFKCDSGGFSRILSAGVLPTIPTAAVFERKSRGRVKAIAFADPPPDAIKKAS